MRVNGHDVGVCSWSLKLQDANELVAALRQLRLSHVHLAVGPLLGMDGVARAAYRRTLADAGIGITSTMIAFPGEDYSSIDRIHRTGGFGPDDQWTVRRD